MTGQQYLHGLVTLKDVVALCVEEQEHRTEEQLHVLKRSKCYRKSVHVPAYQAPLMKVAAN